MKLEKAIEGYLLQKATRASVETIKTDSFLLKQALDHFGDIVLSDLTTQKAVEYINILKARVALSSVHRHFAVLHNLFVWLGSPDIDLCQHNPFETIPRVKLPKHTVEALGQDDIKKLLDACKHSRNPKRDKALVLMLLDTCCRISEIAGIKLNDLDLKEGRALVIGKGNKQRAVFFGQRTKTALWCYIEAERVTPLQSNGDYLFLTDDGYPTNRDNLRHIINRLSTISGVKAHPHLFRHSGAIERLRRGMDLETLRLFLGHSKMSTTQTYLTALTEEDVKDKAKKTSACDDWRL